MTMQRSTIIVAAIVIAGLLAGCRQEEEHPLVLGNGTYTGGGETQLTAGQVSALNDRIMLQGITNTSAGSNESTAEPGPAKAGQPTASDKALDSRLRQQQTGQ
jgi:hypothetical protein